MHKGRWQTKTQRYVQEFSQNRTSGPDVNPADSCRGVVKDGKFATEHKEIEEKDFSLVQACQPEGINKNMIGPNLCYGCRG